MAKSLLFLFLSLAVLGAGSWYGLSLIAPSAPAPAETSTVPVLSATSSIPSAATGSAAETATTSAVSVTTSTPTSASAPAPAPQQTLTPQQLLTTPPSPFAEVKGGTPPDLIVVYFSSYIWLSGKTGYFDLYRSTAGEKGPWTKVDSRVPGDTRSVNDSGYNTAYTNVYYRVVAIDTSGNESQPSPPSRAMKY